MSFNPLQFDWFDLFQLLLCYLYFKSLLSSRIVLFLFWYSFLTQILLGLALLHTNSTFNDSSNALRKSLTQQLKGYEAWIDLKNLANMPVWRVQWLFFFFENEVNEIPYMIRIYADERIKMRQIMGWLICLLVPLSLCANNGIVVVGIRCALHPGKVPWASIWSVVHCGWDAWVCVTQNKTLAAPTHTADEFIFLFDIHFCCSVVK